MTRKEQLKNDILIAMRVHLTAQTMPILSDVITQALYGVEVTQLETQIATVDKTNEYIINLFLARKAPKLSNKTVDQYIRSVNALLSLTGKPLTMISETDIEYFLMRYRSMGNSNTTVNNCRRFLSAFFTWMRRSKIVTENPCESIEKYKEISKPIEHLTPEQWDQLKTGCRHVRDRALIEFLRCTAMRDGEVPEVRVSDIDWREGKIVIFGQKSGRYRIVCLDSLAMTYIDKYLTWRGVGHDSREPLFTCNRDDLGRALKRETIYNSIKAIAKRAGMGVNVYPHLIRKTTATNIVKRGGSVEEAGEYLGHRDNSTAGRHYAYKAEDHVMQIFKMRVAAV